MEHTFDFETMPDRTGRDALAVDVIPVPGAQIREGVSRIPMWVADMNFKTAPSIPEAVIRRAEHPLYGYFLPSDEYYGAITRWQYHRNGVKALTKKQIGYENGVLGCVSSAVQALTLPGDHVFMHAPTYIGFTHVLENTGRKAALSFLRRDEKGIWRMDYEDMDRVIRENHCRLSILCSPHNPCGRVWEREELETAMEIFRKNHCVVLSDEIWSDLTLEGYTHIPTQSISEDARQRAIAVYAPSKTFNLAGLIGSYHVIYNDALREKIRRFSGMGFYNSMNVLSMHALIGAYSETGAAWVDELRKVLGHNVDIAFDAIDQWEGVEASRPQGTYMLFLDFTKYCEMHGITLDEVLKTGIFEGVIWQDGRPFHGTCSIRMNLALPTHVVREAFLRLDKVLKER